MKLRNKKTGEIGDLMGTERSCPYITIGVDFHDGNPRAFDYTSLTELFEEWEDYKTTEPLIKDEKIRKAVRTWAEVNKFSSKMYFTYYGNLHQLSCWQASIEFNRPIEGLETNKEYYITELCGEEE